MASVGHVLVGMAASRFNRHRRAATWTPFGAAVLWSGLSLLPDLDVVGFRLGVHYEDPWGHRGATHSLVFALGVALIALGVAKAARLPALRTALITLVVVSSHPLLDTLTDGGLGCALLWPFSDERFFAPWTPLPVAPIGRAFLSARGVRVAAVEVMALSPLLAYALWPVVARWREWAQRRPGSAQHAADHPAPGPDHRPDVPRGM
jgi:inner membrane protein